MRGLNRLSDTGLANRFDSQALFDSDPKALSRLNATRGSLRVHFGFTSGFGYMLSAISSTLYHLAHTQDCPS